jgi:uncharacterized glyoxalase superfamily protein PhnB
MGARAIQFARRGGTGVPLIQSQKYKTGEAIIKGSLLAEDANGELILHLGGTNKAVVGIALEAADSRPGFDAANSPTVVTGRKQELSYVVADLETVFSAQLTGDGGATITTAAQTHVGEEYGVVKDADGIWYIDTTETVTKIFDIVDFDADLNVVFVKFRTDAIAAGA